MRRIAVLVLVVAVLSAACGLAYEDAGTTTTTTTIAPPSAIPTGPADLVFSDQRIEGTTVVVESVTMPAPGFVVLRIDDAGIPGEVVGVGDVLVRGVVAEVEIPLFVPITDDLVLHAALHIDMDEDGVFTYEPPDDVIDVPATGADGNEASATATIELLPPLGPVALTFEDQRSDGQTVTVADATLPASGFIGIWTSDEGEPDVLVGRSALLPEGTIEGLEVELSIPVEETAPLIAAVHIDRDEDGSFVPGDSFDPIGQTVEGAPAFTTAFVTVVLLGPVDLTVADQEDPDGATLETGTVTVAGRGWVEFSIDGEVVGVSGLLGIGETESLTIPIDPLDPGDYEVSARIVIDFDGDEVLTDFDPVGLDEDGDPFTATFTLTVPEPPDEEDT